MAKKTSSLSSWFPVDGGKCRNKIVKRQRHLISVRVSHLKFKPQRNDIISFVRMRDAGNREIGLVKTYSATYTKVTRSVETFKGRWMIDHTENRDCRIVRQGSGRPSSAM